MSHVTECIELYVGDDEVSDSQFRALILDAAARDATHTTSWVAGFVHAPGGLALPHPSKYSLEDMAAQLAQHAHALVLLNEVDSMRAGQIRVLRERLDNMEGKA